MSVSGWLKYLKEYKEGVVNPCIRFLLHSGHTGSYRSLLSVFIFLLTSFACNYAVIGNDSFVEQLIDRAVSKARTPEERIKAESARETLENTLGSPGVRMLVCTIATLLSVWSLFLIVSLQGAVFSVLLENPDFLKNYLRELFSASLILSFGFATNTILKYIYIDHRITLGWWIILDLSDDRDPVIYLLKRLDFISLLYLVTLSVRISQIFKQETIMVCSISAACMIIIALICYLTGIPFALMQ
jgi:hypothetical protein